MTPARREQLCSYLDSVVEGATDAGLELGSISINVSPDEWSDVRELLRAGAPFSGVACGDWQEVGVFAHLTEPGKPKAARS